MIFEYLFSILLPILEFIFNLLPDTDSAVVDFISGGVDYFRFVIDFGNQFVDMFTFLLVLGFVLTIEITLMIWKVARWIIQILTAGIVRSA